MILILNHQGRKGTQRKSVTAHRCVFVSVPTLRGLPVRNNLQFEAQFLTISQGETRHGNIANHFKTTQQHRLSTTFPGDHKTTLNTMRLANRHQTRVKSVHAREYLTGMLNHIQLFRNQYSN
jgi:ribosomal protein L30/L7E